MEAANQVVAYISKLDLQPIRDHYLFWEILIYIRCKTQYLFRSKGTNETFFKTNTPIGSICFKKKVSLKQKSHSRSLDSHLVFINYANEGLPE